MKSLKPARGLLSALATVRPLSIYLLIGAHCWLRAAETLQLDCSDIVVTDGAPLAFGVVKVRFPKIRRPPVQGVLIESEFVSLIFTAVHRAVGSPPWDAFATFRRLSRLQSGNE